MSVPFSVAEAVEWTHGRLASGSAETRVSGVSIDTRSLVPGQLFVAIRGEQHDAHAFLDRAHAGGAAALLVESDWLREHPAPEYPCVIATENTTRALGDLARGHRAGFSGTVVAITGSNGKTSTKELTHTILSADRDCLKNEGNLNNEFGLPLTLLRRETSHRAAVLELGMNHRGEIARLAAIARPNIGVITNVGTAHIEFLGSQERIALEKGDLLEALPQSGTAVLNADDPLVLQQQGRMQGRVVTFGRSEQADFRADRIHFDPEGAFEFRLTTPQGEVSLRVPGWAETTVDNTLAAVAAALTAGASLTDAQNSLNDFEPVPGRMVCLRLKHGAHLIDDTYNANPQSMRSALESLVRLKGSGRSIAVLGEMGELGPESDEAHKAAGRLAAELGVDLLFALGGQARNLMEGATAAGMSKQSIHAGSDQEEVGVRIGSIVKSDDWILVKGSRAMQMERVVTVLVSGEGD